MKADDLKTLKLVAEWIKRPPHRLIHLCEEGIVVPEVDAEGRGSMRRFNRENIYRLLIGLHMQEIGLQVPIIRQLMEALDQLMQIKEIIELKREIEDYDLPAVIKNLGDPEFGVLAFLNLNERVDLFIPKLKIIPRERPSINLTTLAGSTIWGGPVTITVNLWGLATWLI
jgi:DNA-binding transcriptional MerR regulator